MAARANDYYKLFINWTNERIKSTFAERNKFEFAHIEPFDKSCIKQDGTAF